MDVFDPHRYAFAPSAVSLLAAAAITLGCGGGLLLYERFTAASRRFFRLALVVGGWLTAYAIADLGRAGGVGEPWVRLGLALETFTTPALYAVATHLTATRRERWQRAAWAGAAAFAVLALFGPLRAGLREVFAGRYLDGLAPLGLLYIVFVLAMVAAVLESFLRAFRAAPDELERRRHLTLLVAVAVGALAILDYFVAIEVLGYPGIGPLAIAASVALIGLAATRYRAFAITSAFAADEILRALGDAVLVCDAEGRVRVANPEAHRLLGLDGEQLIGSLLEERLVVEEEVAGGDLWPRPPLGERVRDRQLRLRPRGGEPIDVSVSIEPLTAGDRYVGTVVVARDIRARLAAQHALRVSEQRYSSLFWHSPGAAYEIDPAGRFLHVNRATEALLGAPAARLLGRSFEEVIDRDDLARAGEVFAGVLAGEPREYELAVRGEAGQRRVVRGVSIPVVEDGRVTSVFGVGLDITEVSRVQRDLEIQRQYFSDLFENSPEAIVLIDEEDRILRANGEFHRLFGLAAAGTVGANLDDLIVPPGMRAEAAALTAEARAGRVVRNETVRRRRDGSPVEVSLLARHLRIPGEPPQTYCIYRDIGVRKAAERRLREREEELRHAQKLEAVGKLAGGISHDFNNLLTVVLGHAQMALDELPPGHPVRPDLEEIARAGTRAAELTQRLLAFSRRQVQHPEVLALDAVVGETERMLTRLIGEHITLETELGAAGCHVEADRGQLEQVLVSLVVNARDAMPGGGRVAIRTRRVTLGPEAPAASWEIPAGDYAELVVEDDGSGMDEATRERAFEPFFTTKEPGKGTGLGLATVFGIVKQSGGHVTVDSSPGEGSSFTVYLPLAAEPASGAAAEATAAAAAPAPGRRVLIAEDEPAVRQLAARVLERAGYEVVTAEDGATALERAVAAEAPFDIVLTDLVMPRMGGRELAARLRTESPRTRILFMSGYDDELARGVAVGEEFLPKPFTAAALIEKIAALRSRDGADEAVRPPG